MMLPDILFTLFLTHVGNLTTVKYNQRRFAPPHAHITGIRTSAQSALLLWSASAVSLPQINGSRCKRISTSRRSSAAVQSTTANRASPHSVFPRIRRPTSWSVIGTIQRDLFAGGWRPDNGNSSRQSLGSEAVAYWLGR
jgi:hypothetical protein